jgi:Pathogenicity locus
MSPSKVIRSRVRTLTDLPNIGKSIAQDLVLLGLTQPAHLTGQDPYAMYDRLCRQTGVVHDPCLLDTFISVTRFMDGEPPQPWWHYTPERKRRLAARGPLRK